MNDLGAPREGGEVAGHPVVEPETDPDDEVGLLDRAVDMHLPVHPGHTEMKRMRFGKALIPSSVVITGIPVRSASARSSA